MEAKVNNHFQRISEGCGRGLCDSPSCHSNFRIRDQLPTTPKDIALAAITLAKEDKQYCTKIIKPLTVEEVETGLANEGGPTREFLDRIYRVFENSESLSSSFLNEIKNEGCCLLNPKSVFHVFNLIQSAHESVQQAVIHAINSLLSSLKMAIQQKPQFITTDILLNQFLICFELPFLIDDTHYDPTFHSLCFIVSSLEKHHRDTLWMWLSMWPVDQFSQIVAKIQQYITLTILMSSDVQNYAPSRDPIIFHAIRCLEIFNLANEAASPKLIDYNAFYNDAVNNSIDAVADFLHWQHLERQDQGHLFAFCDYHFVLEPATKVEVLDVENRVSHQQNARTADIFQLILRGHDAMFFSIKVRRDHLLRDALTSISHAFLTNPEVMKKPLRVEFDGEPGVDAGGVRKEFFQLAIRGLFDLTYGMFTYDEETRLFWFSPNCLESPEEFKLLGILLGLALYNNTILDLHFPKAVYKKLMGQNVDVNDLNDFNPGLQKALINLLNYENDDFESIYDLNFTFTREAFGEVVVVDLCENGSNIQVTKENRQTYVQLYVDYALNTSIRDQFAAFKEGFETVCSGSKALKMFRSCEIELVICGKVDLDINTLKSVCEYDGYQNTDQVVIWFWEVVATFSDEEKKKLLSFATGTDRVSIGGLSKTKFVIAKQGPDSNFLPSAHTCFNVLLLPNYSSKEKLDTLLRKAILHAEGFGLR